MARFFKDLIVAEPDAQPRVTMRKRDGSVALGDVTVEVSSRVQQAGDPWSAACANVLLQLNDNGAPVARTDNPTKVTAAQVGLGEANNTPDADKTVKKALYAVRDERGNNLVEQYASGLTTKDRNVNLVNRVGGVLSTITVPFAQEAAEAFAAKGGKMILGTGNLRQTTNQSLYLSASNEADYDVVVGVFDGKWTVSPVVNGNFLLGTPNKRWDALHLRNAPNVASDRKGKQDIAPLDVRYTELLLRLPACRYRLVGDADSGYRCGFVAQDVEALLAELKLAPVEFTALVKSPVYKDVQVLEPSEISENGDFAEAYTLVDRQLQVPEEYTYSLRYEEFIAPLLALVQKQQTQIDAQQQLLEKLSQRIDALETNKK